VSKGQGKLTEAFQGWAPHENRFSSCEIPVTVRREVVSGSALAGAGAVRKCVPSGTITQLDPRTVYLLAEGCTNHEKTG